MIAAERQAVLILGMHRSGTSAVAGAANLLGATAPARMFAPAADNPSGFWESAAVVATNNRIMGEAGSSWYDCLGFDCASLDVTARTRALTFIMLSLLSDYRQGHLLLIKDPRLSLLLDLWLPALQQMKIAPSLLLVLRPPGEVAASLAKRNALPAAYVTALWLRHMLAAEYASRGCARHILIYDALLRDWRGALLRASRAATFTWPVSFDAVAQQIPKYLNDQLRHHRTYTSTRQTVGDPLGLWADEVYEILYAFSATDGNAHQLERLDSVRAAFWDWCRTHQRTWTENVLTGHALRNELRIDVPVDWEAAVSRLQLVNPPASLNA